jgi:bacteriocin-like protein
MQTRKASPKPDVRPTAPLPVQPLTEKEMSSVSGGFVALNMP